MNILIKLMSIVSLVIAPTLAQLAAPDALEVKATPKPVVKEMVQHAQPSANAYKLQ
jgi:hypothetical protein